MRSSNTSNRYHENMNRVVVTGLGVVSSIGTGVDEFWPRLLAGTNGISDIEAFDVSDYPSRKGGEIKDFDAVRYIGEKRFTRMGRASQFGVAAAKLALDDAGLEIDGCSDIGVCMGTTLADAQSLEQIDKYWVRCGESEVWDSNIVKYPAYNLTRSIDVYFGLDGVNFVIPTACAAGNYSIGLGYDLIRTGRCDIVIAGGADPIARTNFSGFNRLLAMAPEQCQPFDKNRKGMMVGEGAGVLLLEALENALARGAKIYAEVAGHGQSCDAYNMTIPSEEGIMKVMEKALANSGVKRSDIGYICAHGTGTPANDKVECSAIKGVFGDIAEEIPVSSIKSMLGHTMGAASAIEAIACCLALQDGMLPPTINFKDRDPECDLDCVPNKARKKDIRFAINNSFAFGGNNSSLVLGKYEP